jgi:hypothetical protein
MNHRALFGFVASLLIGAGCQPSTAAYGDVETRLEVDRARANVGEAVGLTAIATNHGDQTVQFLADCGPGLDFEVQSPSGDRRYLLRGQPSICPIFDSNFLEPGETDTVFSAFTPELTGTYRLWAGGRVREGLAARSLPVRVIVD